MRTQMLHSFTVSVWILLFTALVCAFNSQLAQATSASTTTISHSIPVALINNNSSYPVNIASNMLYLTDPDHVLSLDDVLRQKQDWRAIHKPSPNFGFSADAYWFRFNVQSNLDNVQKVFIELPIPFLDDIQLFHRYQAQLINTLQVGDKYPFSERPIAHPNYILPLEIKPGLNEIIMRVAAEGTIEVPLSIWTPERFSASTSTAQFFQGIWLGIVGIMVLYNAMLFIFLRDQSYLCYVFFTASYLLFQLSLKGFGFAYIWPESTHWNSYAIATFIACSNLGAAMMVISFLDLKEQHALAYKIMTASAIFGGLCVLLTFFVSYTAMIRVTSAHALVTCIICLLTGYVAMIKGNKHARVFCLAWTAALIGTTVLGCVKFGLVPENYWTNNASQIGVVALVSLLSIAFANRINLEKELRLSAQASALRNEQIARRSQEELIKSKESANEQLEKKVSERTRALEQTLSELELANNRLEILSTTDSLTTLFNRGHFERRMNIEFNRASRHKRELSVILCDLDHFKVINDTYGHKAGDECLRHFALTLKNKITRSGDLIARYGGEEFIILLVDTPLESATKIAEELCQETNESPIQTQDHTIQMSASFGIASLTQSSSILHSEQLVHYADMALYEAKHQGRNGVEVWDKVTENTHST